MNLKEKQFISILSDNQEKLFRICCYYLKNREDRKDLFQEILFNIWKSLGNFRSESAIDTWIYRIALNTAIGYSIREHKRQRYTVGIDLESFHNLLPDEDKEQRSQLEESLEELHLKINQLSIIDKAIMALLLEDLSSKEIANIVGITEPNVRIKIHRIKNQIKIEMKGVNYEN